MVTLLEDAPGRGCVALDEEECFKLLHEGSFGRIAVSVGAIPAVLPVNYCALEGAIYFFTAEGSSLASATRDAVVAFEVDHFDTTYHEGWSVLAVGFASEVREPAMYELVRRLPLRPWAPGSRGYLVRIWPDFVTGRRIAGGGAIRSMEASPQT